MTEQLIIILCGLIFASNGLMAMLVKRSFAKKDNSNELVLLVKKIVETNNRQGEELVILSDISIENLKLNKSLIYALHEKKVFNGNTVEFNKKIQEMENKIDCYSKSKKDKGLFV